MRGTHSGTAPPNVPAEQIYACWNEIGVYGASSCVELQQFVHCRNCPVYSHAGAQLLNRELPAGYRREWTEHFALEKKIGKPGKTSALLFRLSGGGPAPPDPAFPEGGQRPPIHATPPSCP